MATIKTAIALYDGVTNPLQRMHRALSIVLDSFESMERASAHAVDTAAIQEAREELARAGTAFDAIEENIRAADDRQNQFNRRIQTGTTAAESLWGKLRGIAATLGGLAAVKQAVGLSDSLTSTNARLSLIVDDGGSVEALERKIMASAQRARAYYFDTASAIASLGANAGAAFSGNDELIAFLEQVNKQFVIGGATPQGQAAAMLQLTQAMAAGALRGEELNSILENAPGIARAIEQYMGAAEGSIKAYAEEGLVTASVVKNALFAAADETNAKFESMPKTWGQIWTSMENNALSIFSPILNRINEIGNSERFTRAADGLINGLAAVGTMAAWAFDLLTSGTALAADNWGWLAPLILGVAGAYLILHGAMLAYNTVQAVGSGLSALAAAQAAIHAGATLGEAAAATTATGAQAGLNAALLACPITWIILAVVALIAIFYAAVAAVNHFAGTSLSATGLIAGGFLTMAALVGNAGIGLFNGLIQFFWSLFAYPVLGGIEWLLNAANGGFDSFGGAVANLIGNIIGWFLSLGQVVTTIIDAIFGTNWTAGLEALKSDVTAWGKNENAITIDRTAPTIDYRFSYGDAFRTGNEFGQGIEDSVKGLFDFSGMDPMGAGGDPFALGDTLEDIYGSTADTAANTAAAADALDFTQEDLTYLRDIAEREAINRFTTAEIKIEQHNENHLSSDTDLDGIMDAWASDFARKLDISTEGVHT